jgi:hypothetical protein
VPAPYLDQRARETGEYHHAERDRGHGREALHRHHALVGAARHRDDRAWRIRWSRARLARLAHAGA